jgi:hypothetical protein
MSIEKLGRWSGLAAAIGGPLWLFPWSGWLTEVSDSAGFVIALVGLLLVMIGLIGLNRRIASGPGASGGPTFRVAQLGVGLVMASAVGGLATGASLSGGAPILAVVLFAGMVAMIVGTSGMGRITWKQKALGRSSFAPLLLAASLLGYVISIGLAVSNPALEPINDIFIALNMVCWIIFGYSLAAAEEQMVDSALPA